MAITDADIKFKHSVTTGPGNSTAQADPNASLGEFMSSTEVTDATLHNLFDKVTGDENAESDVEYRCIFVHNDHATLTWEDVVIWLDAQVAGGAVAAIGLDPVGVVAEDSASAQADEIGDEDEAPAGVSFSAPSTKGTGIAVGDVGPGECFAVWVRRTAANTGAVDNDGATLAAEGDTAA